MRIGIDRDLHPSPNGRHAVCFFLNEQQKKVGLRILDALTGKDAGVPWELDVEGDFGQLVGMPKQQTGNTAKLQFIARPDDYNIQKENLAESMRVLTWWDPVWIADRIDDPDTVLAWTSGAARGRSRPHLA